MVAGIVAIGLPLFDATGRASAGLSVGVPTVRFDSPRARRLEAALREAAAEISAALGWRKDRRSSAA
jgi:DNA-binding IclR family transcriptional regulator